MRAIVIAGIVFTAFVPSAQARSGSFGGSPVHVRASTRSDGIFVRSHDRAQPRTLGAARPFVVAVPVLSPTFSSTRVETPTTTRSARTETLRPVAAPIEIVMPAPRADAHRDASADVATAIAPRPQDLAGQGGDPTSEPMVASNSAPANPVAADDPHWCDDGDLRGGFCVMREHQTR